MFGREWFDRRGRAAGGQTWVRGTRLPRPAAGVAARYGDQLDGYIVDHADADAIGNVGARVTIARTLMKSLEDREALARVTLDAVDVLASQR